MLSRVLAVGISSLKMPNAINRFAKLEKIS